MHRNARLFILLIALYLTTTLGCKDAPVSDPDIPESLKIARLVDMVDDFASEPDEAYLVPRLFAPGSEPSAKDLPRYSEYRYEGKPAVFKGDTATVVVMVKDAKTEKPVGEVTWSMKKLKNIKAIWNNADSGSGKGEVVVREDKGGKDVWRITDAPLPAR
jgi:hypothetical protein